MNTLPDELLNHIAGFNDNPGSFTTDTITDIHLLIYTDRDSEFKIPFYSSKFSMYTSTNGLYSEDPSIRFSKFAYDVTTDAHCQLFINSRNKISIRDNICIEVGHILLKVTNTPNARKTLSQAILTILQKLNL